MQAAGIGAQVAVALFGGGKEGRAAAQVKEHVALRLPTVARRGPA